MVSRRTTILGIGGLLVGSGALLSTGAFTTIETQRSVALETAGDANAFLGLEILDPEFVDETDGTIEFDLLANATTTYEELIDIRNNGTQVVTSLRFEFIVEGADQDDADTEDALQIISGDATIDANDEVNLLFESDVGDADDDRLSPGEAIPIGIGVDLTDDAIDRIDGDPEITLRIIADTGEVEEDPGGDPDPILQRFVFDDGPNAFGEQGPPNNIEFTVENQGGEVTLEAFRVDVSVSGDGDPNRPSEFGEYVIDPPQEATFDEADEFSVDTPIEHTEYDIGLEQTVTYEIREFDENNMRGVIENEAVDIDIILIGTDGMEYTVSS